MRIVSTQKWALLRAVAVFSLLLVLTSMSIGPAAAQGVACVVSTGVTQEGDTITGTSGNDTIDCSSATTGKTITGGDGNDTITGGLGNDYIDGGPGNDTITGGPANDCLYGREGNDTLTGSAGSNTIDPGAGENTVSDNNDPGGAITGCTTSVSTVAPGVTSTVAPGVTSTVAPGVTSTVAPGVTSTVAPGVTSTVVPGVTSTVVPGNGPTLVSVSTSSPSVVGGDSTTGVVTLSAPAAAGGATVLLVSDNPSAGVAASVFVLEGDTTAVFEIATSAVAATTSATITASWNGVYASAELEVRTGAASVAPGQPGSDAAVTVDAQAGADNSTGGAAVVTSLPSTGTVGGAEQGLSMVVLVAGTVALAAFAMHHVWTSRRVS